MILKCQPPVTNFQFMLSERNENAFERADVDTLRIQINVVLPSNTNPSIFFKIS